MCVGGVWARMLWLLSMFKVLDVVTSTAGKKKKEEEGKRHKQNWKGCRREGLMQTDRNAKLQSSDCSEPADTEDYKEGFPTA